jgi:ApaG protein
MFEAVTKNVRVQVQPSYVKDESDPAQDYYFFAYKVNIRNESERSIQLMSRHWVIKDAYGNVEEVRGPGVVGLQPKLGPGEAFEYSSFCPLNTPTGSMQGTYQMVSDKGDQFDIEIPLFILAEPSHYH